MKIGWAVTFVMGGVLSTGAMTTRALAQEAAADDAISGTLTTTATTHYFFRGLIQEDQGLIFQPALDLGVALWEGEGELQSLRLFLGTWNSLHSGPTGSSGSGTSSPSSWYESDFYAGINVGFADDFTLMTHWLAYTSPNGSYDTINEVNVALSYDDSSLWGESGFSGLAPTLSVAFEIDGQTDQATEPQGTDQGIFLGVGIEPSFVVGHLGSEPDAAEITLTVPAHAGFSFSDYYEDATGDDDTFGYWDLGTFVAFPLNGVPARYGSWEMSLGVQGVFLAGHQKELNHDEGFELVGTAALSIGF